MVAELFKCQLSFFFSSPFGFLESYWEMLSLENEIKIVWNLTIEPWVIYILNYLI